MNQNQRRLAIKKVNHNESYYNKVCDSHVLEEEFTEKQSEVVTSHRAY